MHFGNENEMFDGVFIGRRDLDYIVFGFSHRFFGIGLRGVVIIVGHYMTSEGI